MIRSWMTALLLTAAMLAQDSPAPKVRVILPEGVYSAKVYLRYGLHQPDGHYSQHLARMPAGVSSAEIPAPTDRFKALVWAPGCKIREFDVPVEKADIQLQFACDPLKIVSLRGRVKSAETIGTLSVDYAGMIACYWADFDATSWRFVDCSGIDIQRVATAAVAPDGSFEIELPDFHNDPIVSKSSGELYFWLTGIDGTVFLVPEASPTKTFIVKHSYPAEVIFVPGSFLPEPQWEPGVIY